MSENNSTEKKAPKTSFFKGLKAEFKKIIWPNSDTVVKQTRAVAAASLILGLVIAFMDMLMKFGIDRLLLLAK